MTSRRSSALHGIAVANLPLEAQIAGLPVQLGPHGGLPRVEGLCGVGDGREGIIVDHDLVGGVARESGAFGNDQGHGIADMAHALLHQSRPGRHRDRRPVAIGKPGRAGDRAETVLCQILAGQYRQDARQCRRRRDVERADPGVGMRRAQNGRIGLVRARDIVEIAAIAREETPILDAPDRLADAELLHSRPPARQPMQHRERRLPRPCRVKSAICGKEPAFNDVVGAALLCVNRRIGGPL